MKRTKKRNNNPSAILTADWHLREDTPVCRTDNFWEAQWNKVDQVSALQIKYDCPVIMSGDLFNHWKPSPFLLSMCIKSLPNQFFMIYGNHDLPQHNLALQKKSGVHTLLTAGKVDLLSGYHWGTDPNDDNIRYSFRFASDHKVAVWHTMTYQAKKPWPGMTDPMAAKLLRKYPQFELIVTGHNHKTFVEEHEGRLLVNPGSLTRQASDQVDHEPCVFLYYAETNTVEKVILDYNKDVITREHIEKTENRDQRIDAFISKLDKDWEAEMSFEENLERFASTNKVKPEVMTIIHKAIE